jgi:hypothetical protein
MAYQFLTDEWFGEVDRLLKELGSPTLPDKLQGVTLNVIIEDGNGGQPVKVNYRGCYFQPGFADDAQATITTSRDIAYEVMIKKNMAMGIRALSTRKAKLSGDRRKLMPLASVRPTDEQKTFEERVMEVTTL